MSQRLLGLPGLPAGCFPFKKRPLNFQESSVRPFDPDQSDSSQEYSAPPQWLLQGFQTSGRVG